MATIYGAYGLAIQSELNLDELPVLHNTQPDVLLELGPVPENLAHAKLQLLVVSANANQMLLNIKGVAKVLVTNGTHIMVDIAPQTSLNDIKAFLYSTIITGLLQQRGVWMLHASVIEVGGAAVLFAGRSGDGKSTLAAQFNQRGYAVLSDDIAAMYLDSSGCVQVRTGIPRIKLWQDALTQLGLASKHLNPVRNELQKYSLPLINTQPKSLPVKALYVIKHIKTSDITLNPITGDRRFLVLKNQTHKQQLYQAQGDVKQRFLCSAQLMQQATMQFIKHSHTATQIPELLDTLEQSFEHLK